MIKEPERSQLDQVATEFRLLVVSPGMRMFRRAFCCMPVPIPSGGWSTIPIASGGNTEAAVST